MAVQPNNIAKKLAPRNEYYVLAQVATVPFVCKVFGRSRGAVMNLIETEQLAAEKVFGTWLVSVASCVRLWGSLPVRIVESD